MKARLSAFCFLLLVSPFVVSAGSHSSLITHHLSLITSSPRLTLSSENFRVSYPARAARRDAEAALRALEAARADLLRHLSAASVSASGLTTVELYAHETTGGFTGATGQPAWVAAATTARGRRIESQPLDVLRRRGVLPVTLRHEYVHVVVETLGHGRAPRWLAEGLALYVSGEGVTLARRATKSEMSLDELEQRLARPGSPEEMKSLYAAAFRAVSALVAREGEANVWRRVTGY